MSLIATDKSNYKPVDAGTYSAVCVGMIDMGTQNTAYGTKQQVLFQFEMDAERDDGNRYVISKAYTNSLNKKARLREDLDAWRGRPFTPEEIKGFDLRKVLGAPCLLTVTHGDNEGNVYAKIHAVAKLPKGMASIEPSNDPVFFDMEERDPEVLKKLPEWLRDKIEAAPEWNKLPEEPEVSEKAKEENFSDTIPF